MKAYWNNTGTHQELANRLQALVPLEGPCEFPRSKNKALDKFRRASNAYYDIFNNGGCNFGPLIRDIFGISMSYFKSYSVPMYRWEDIHNKIAPIMDEIILATAREQGLL